MIYKKVFVDSDILLDLLLEREPFLIYSRTLFTKEIRDSIELYTSTLILANVYYLISKNINKNAAIASIKYVMALINVAPFEVGHIQSAVVADQSDFEDCIQYFIAKQNKCDVIITRNLKHYKKFDIPALNAEEFLRRIL